MQLRVPRESMCLSEAIEHQTASRSTVLATSQCRPAVIPFRFQGLGFRVWRVIVLNILPARMFGINNPNDRLWPVPYQHPHAVRLTQPCEE